MTPFVIGMKEGSSLPAGIIIGMLAIKPWARVGRCTFGCCAAGPVGGLKTLLDDSEGDGTAETEPARGPVGIPLGPEGGMVGETDWLGMWRGGIEGQPPLPPPRGVNPPPQGGT